MLKWLRRFAGDCCKFEVFEFYRASFVFQNKEDRSDCKSRRNTVYNRGLRKLLIGECIKICLLNMVDLFFKECSILVDEADY